jgi:Cu/Ag efflux protein CusF
MRHSIRQISAVATLMAAAAWTPGVHAQAASTASPASSPASSASVPLRSAGERVIVTGRVTDIDMTKRELTLRDAQEREMTFRIDPSMQSLQDVKVGDRVQLEYAVAVAVALKKGGGDMRQRVEEEARQQSAPGQPQGEASGRRTTLVADVLSIDREAGTVRLRGPEGRIRDVKVRDKTRLEEVKTGDQIVAVVEEALAMRIQPEK